MKQYSVQQVCDVELPCFHLSFLSLSSVPIHMYQDWAWLVLIFGIRGLGWIINMMWKHLRIGASEGGCVRWIARQQCCEVRREIRKTVRVMQ